MKDNTIEKNPTSKNVYQSISHPVSTDTKLPGRRKQEVIHVQNISSVLRYINPPEAHHSKITFNGCTIELRLQFPSEKTTAKNR